MDQDFIPGIDPSLVAAAAQQEAEKKKDAARIVDSLDGFTLTSWGFSSALKVTRGNKVEYLKLKLKSVGVQDVMEYYQSKAPTPPSVTRTYKKDSEVVRQLGYKHDVVVREIDEANGDYLRAKAKHDNESGQYIALAALGYDLKIGGQVVMKGADMNVPNEIIDQDAALIALRQLGLSSSHYAEIMKNVRTLTEEAEAQESFL